MQGCRWRQWRCPAAGPRPRSQPAWGTGCPSSSATRSGRPRLHSARGPGPTAPAGWQTAFRASPSTCLAPQRRARRARRDVRGRGRAAAAASSPRGSCRHSPAPAGTPYPRRESRTGTGNPRTPRSSRARSGTPWWAPCPRGPCRPARCHCEQRWAHRGEPGPRRRAPRRSRTADWAPGRPCSRQSPARSQQQWRSIRWVS